MAERVGFEPTVPLRAQRFSRPSQSTTLAPLRNCEDDPGSRAGAGRQAARLAQGPMLAKWRRGRRSAPGSHPEPTAPTGRRPELTPPTGRHPELDSGSIWSPAREAENWMPDQVRHDEE